MLLIADQTISISLLLHFMRSIIVEMDYAADINVW